MQRSISIYVCNITIQLVFWHVPPCIDYKTNQFEIVHLLLDHNNSNMGLNYIIYYSDMCQINLNYVHSLPSSFVIVIVLIPSLGVCLQLESYL